MNQVAKFDRIRRKLTDQRTNEPKPNKYERKENERNKEILYIVFIYSIDTIIIIYNVLVSHDRFNNNNIHIQVQ